MGIISLLSRLLSTAEPIETEAEAVENKPHQFGVFIIPEGARVTMIGFPPEATIQIED
jgi:hypothetical protein